MEVFPSWCFPITGKLRWISIPYHWSPCHPHWPPPGWLISWRERIFMATSPGRLSVQGGIRGPFARYFLRTPNLGSMQSLHAFIKGRKIGFGRLTPDVLASMPSVYQTFPHALNDWIIDSNGRYSIRRSVSRLLKSQAARKRGGSTRKYSRHILKFNSSAAEDLCGHSRCRYPTTATS